MTTADVKSCVYKYIQSKDDILRFVGLELWKNPELGLQEKFAHQLLTDTLIKENFQVTKEFIVETGFKAEYKTADTPHIMIICEYDALPNIGHACGHNLIAEAGIGAAFGLKHAMDNYNIKCRLTVLGTPAEENFGCKITMINNGVLENVDAAMMVHPREMNSYHMPHYALQDVEITFFGQSAHATGSPWEGKNALDAATIAYQGLALFRKQMKSNWHINANIRLDPNSVIGIIPDKVKMEVDIRCGNMEDMDELMRRIKQISEGAAMITDCKFTVDTFEEVYASLVSNKVILRHFKENAKEFNLSYEDVYRSGGSTDMGNISMVVPSIHPVYFIGSQQGPHTELFAACTGKDDAHKFTMIQCKILAGTAIDIASDASILKEAKMEFNASKEKKFPEETFSKLY